jgi:basic amino acid/polyamine antiporter, APA family
VYSYAENVKNSLLGTAIILLGVPLFLVFRKGERPHSSQNRA